MCVYCIKIYEIVAPTSSRVRLCVTHYASIRADSSGNRSVMTLQHPGIQSAADCVVLQCVFIGKNL